jgi:hypothetical protein
MIKTEYADNMLTIMLNFDYRYKVVGISSNIRKLNVDALNLKIHATTPNYYPSILQELQMAPSAAGVSCHNSILPSKINSPAK